MLTALTVQTVQTAFDCVDRADDCIVELTTALLCWHC